MPKNPQPQSYSLSAKFLIYGLPVIAIAGLWARFYDLCESESDSLSTGIASLGSLLCPLYYLAKQAPAYDSNEGESCLTSFVPQLYDKNDLLKSHISFANTPDDVKNAFKLGYKIDDGFGRFENTLCHTKVMNHDYTSLLNIYGSLSPKDKIKIDVAKDFNGRTTCHLGAVTCAPGPVQRTLITPHNAMMADKNGVTLPMLAAAGFMNLQTTQHLFETIGKDNLAKAFAAKDNQGRSVKDYSQLSKEETMKILEEFEVDPYKANNHCFNAFNMGSEAMPICTVSSNTTYLMEQDFEIGIVKVATEPYICIKATKNNLKKINNLADVNDNTFAKTRAALDGEVYGGLTREKKHKLWLAHQKESKRLLKEGISSKPLIDVMMQRREANQDIFKFNRGKKTNG